MREALLNTYLILLRAIGPVTHKLMSMEDWRFASAKAGFGRPRTVGNTGNMIASFPANVSTAEKAMTDVLRSFGLGENVMPILRNPSQVSQLLKSDPIPEAAQERPNQTGVYFFASSEPDFDWLDDYEGVEVVRVVCGHLVIDFTQDVAKSGKLLRLINKHCGMNTARSWSSLVKIMAAIEAG